MPTRHYEGPSIEALLERVRREAGGEAKILRAQKVRKGGVFGFFARELFELTVDVPPGTPLASAATGGGTGGRGGKNVRIVQAAAASRRPRVTRGARVGGRRPPLPRSGPGTARRDPQRASAQSSDASRPTIETGISGRGSSSGIDSLLRRRYADLEGVDQQGPSGTDPFSMVGGEGLSGQASPQGEGLSGQASPQGEGLSGQASPQGAGLSGQASPQGAGPDDGVLSEKKPAGAKGLGRTPDRTPGAAASDGGGGTDGGSGADFRDLHDADETTAAARSKPESPAATFWSYFIGPRPNGDNGGSGAAGENVASRARTGGARSSEAESYREGDEGWFSVEASHPMPSTESAAFVGVMDSLAADTAEPVHAARSIDDRVGTRVPKAAGYAGLGRSVALQRLPLPHASDYFEDLSAMGSDHMATVGEAPMLPPEVIRILTRIPIAGVLPPGAYPDGIPTEGLSARGEALPGWGAVWPTWRSWHPTPAAWGAALAPATHGDIFASSPFLPRGLSAIGFPAAMLPTREVSELVDRFAEPGGDTDSLELARGIFCETLADLPQAPDMPAEPGMLLAVVGELHRARELAAKLAAERGVDPAEIVVAAPEGEHDDVPAWMVIETEEMASKRRPRWRGKKEVTIVAVAAPLTSTDRTWARGILDSLQPDLVCGVVQATHKPEDIAAWAIDLGRVDSLALEGGRATRTPAAILACGIPVALIDGQEADPDLWSSIVDERLALV